MIGVVVIVIAWNIYSRRKSGSGGVDPAEIAEALKVGSGQGRFRASAPMGAGGYGGGMPGSTAAAYRR